MSAENEYWVKIPPEWSEEFCALIAKLPGAQISNLPPIAEGGTSLAPELQSSSVLTLQLAQELNMILYQIDEQTKLTQLRFTNLNEEQKNGRPPSWREFGARLSTAQKSAIGNTFSVISEYLRGNKSQARDQHYWSYTPTLFEVRKAAAEGLFDKPRVPGMGKIRKAFVKIAFSPRIEE